MSLHDRSHRIDQLINALMWESELRILRAEQARRARQRTIIVAADGTATLPHAWQATVEPVGCNSGNSDPSIPQLAGE